MTTREISSRFWDWIDSRGIVRRLAMGITLYLTVYVTLEGWQFAMVSQFDGLGTAACIAAVTAPLAALQGYVFKWYGIGRGEGVK
jgi:hypothetical protein